MKRTYKNHLELRNFPDPAERRKNISKEIVRHSDYLPKTVDYEDIDRSFKEWVEKDLTVIVDGKELPTMVLYANQRFSEYMQSWSYTDENNNVRINFKTVSRESNPSYGTIHGKLYNIPGDRFYKLKSLKAVDESGRKYRVDYEMKQPTSVDFKYKVSIVSNRYVALNQMNELVNRKFNAMQVYISPNGHYMPMFLENISDESEYNINDRQFFSQSFTITVRGYIIKEDDYRVSENPATALVCFEGDTAKRRKTTIDLTEYDPCDPPPSRYYNKPISIDIDFCFCAPAKGKTPEFMIGEHFTLSGMDELTDDNNLIEDKIRLYVDGNLLTENLYEDLLVNQKTFSIEGNSLIVIQATRKKRLTKDENGNTMPYTTGYLRLWGYNKYAIYDSYLDHPETEGDKNVVEETLIDLPEGDCGSL